MIEWKKQLGIEATYRKLMDVFKFAGYKNYADIVKSVASVGDSDTDESSYSDDSDRDYPLPQPPTYYLPQEPYSTRSSFQTASSQDESRRVLVNPSRAESLLKDGNNKNFNYLW